MIQSLEKNCFGKTSEKREDQITSRFVEQPGGAGQIDREEFLKSYELAIMGDESAISFISDSFSNQYLPKMNEVPVIRPAQSGSSTNVPELWNYISKLEEELVKTKQLLSQKLQVSSANVKVKQELEEQVDEMAKVNF